MTLAEYQTYVNKLATLENVLPGLHVAIRILDVRSNFGRIDVLVTPIAGVGETWVNVNRVIVEGDKS